MEKRKYDFFEISKVKKMAIEYFPNFFGENLIVTTDHNIDDLEREYLEYCKKYFNIFERDTNNERYQILQAYEYIKTHLKEHTKFQANSELSKKILQSYDELISTMGSYKFSTYDDTSYGAVQNNTNKNILLEISLFQPFFESVLKNIDDYFATIPEAEQIDEFYCGLVSKLEELKNLLDHSEKKLKSAQEEYHTAWNGKNAPYYYRRDYNIPSYTASELGEAKKEWRLKRNEACYSILKFFKGLENINKTLYCNVAEFREKDNELEISNLYNGAVTNIVKGPNYFCYLDEGYKRKVAEQIEEKARQKAMVKKIES